VTPGVILPVEQKNLPVLASSDHRSVPALILDQKKIDVNDARSTRTEWVLTEEAFGRFLSHLDADAERAGEKYEALRQKLLKFFDWRGAHFPEECADETINRVVRKLEAGETIRDLHTYCHGVARLVFLETLKKPDRHQVSLDELRSVAAPAPYREEDSARRECFARCLGGLPAESRQLILQYYQDERRDKIKNRQALAARLGIPLNALRCRVQRIRDRLERCVTDCLGGPLSPGGTK
jgi:DNA-directed RNA polymerase specialized sigma24 family protein